MNTTVRFLIGILFLAVSQVGRAGEEVPKRRLFADRYQAFRSLNILFLDPEETLCIEEDCFFDGGGAVIVLTRNGGSQFIIKAGTRVVMTNVTFIMSHSDSLKIEPGGFLEMDQNVRLVTVEKVASLEDVFSLMFNAPPVQSNDEDNAQEISIEQMNTYIPGEQVQEAAEEPLVTG